MSWLRPIVPPKRYDDAWLRGYMEDIRNSINNLDASNVPAKWQGQTIISISPLQIDTALAKITVAQVETLVVGTNVAMGDDATIAWSKVTDQPFIPAGYTDEEALAAWASSGFGTYIGATGIYTGEVLAEKIIAGTITGSTIRSDSGTTRLQMQSGAAGQIDWYSGGSITASIHFLNNQIALQSNTGIGILSPKVYLGTEGGAYLGNTEIADYLIASRGWCDDTYSILAHTHDYSSVYAALAHTHDDRYFTETEINALKIYSPTFSGSPSYLLKFYDKSGAFISVDLSSLV